MMPCVVKLMPEYRNALLIISIQYYDPVYYKYIMRLRSSAPKIVNDPYCTGKYLAVVRFITQRFRFQSKIVYIPSQNH